MNPTFSFILALLLVTVSIAQKKDKGKDKEKVSHENMEGDWILQKCSGSEYLDNNPVPQVGVRFAISKNAIADSDLVLYKQKNGDGVFDGAITASRSRKPSHNSWAKVVEKASKKGKDFQDVMVSIGKGVTSVDMISKDEFVINYKYKKLTPKCTFKRSPKKLD